MERALLLDNQNCINRNQHAMPALCELSFTYCHLCNLWKFSEHEVRVDGAQHAADHHRTRQAPSVSSVRHRFVAFDTPPRQADLDISCSFFHHVLYAMVTHRRAKLLCTVRC